MKKMLIAAMSLIACAGMVHAASTITDALPEGSGYSYSSMTAPYMLENTIDFSDVPTTASNDVVQVLQITEPAFVGAVMYEVSTAGAAGTVNIGDGADADRYKASLSVTSTTDWVVSPATSWTVYNADDTIDLTVSGARSDGVVRLRALVWPIIND